MKELEEIRQRLKEMAEQETSRLFRLARRAKVHGCKTETVEGIRNEARWLHETGTAYPERLIHWKFEYDFKYAFRIGGR